MVEVGDEVVVSSSCGREISVLCEERSLEVVESLDELRNDEVNVSIPLTMSMGAVVSWCSIYSDVKVSTMVQVEPAKKVLVRLTTTCVLCHNYAGDHL